MIGQGINMRNMEGTWGELACLLAGCNCAWACEPVRLWSSVCVCVWVWVCACECLSARASGLDQTSQVCMWACVTVGCP